MTKMHWTIAVIVTFIAVAISSGLYLNDKWEKEKLLGKQSDGANLINDSMQATFTAIPDSATVFVGTSLTADWHLKEYFNETRLVNRGIPFNSITHIRKRIPEICRYQPKAIVLEGGINDVINGKDKVVIFTEIKDITDSILILSPKTQIYLTSILPVSSKGDSAKYNPIIRDVNEMVRSHVLYVRDAAARWPDRAGNVLNQHYVDYYKNMTEDMYTDDVHLNAKGYLTLKHILNYKFHETDSTAQTKAHH